MEKFAHFNAQSLDEAVTILDRYKKRARIIAGGTDILGKMKDRVLPDYPEALVNIKEIPGLSGIEEKRGYFRIGALSLLEDIAHHPRIKSKYTALAEAARRTASPHLREMGTIGGNICQDIRCWYYRNQNNRFDCLRKGGGKCYALDGDKRYHSIFGGSVSEGCIAVHPSDTAPALVVLGAQLQTTKRKIAIDNFFEIDVCRTTVLDDNEILTEIQLPECQENTRSAFLKFAFRKSIDFPIVNCAVAVTTSEGRVVDAKICLNSVFVKPYRVERAEQKLKGEIINQKTAEAIGKIAVQGAKPLGDNDYMVIIAKTLVTRAILSCAQ